MAETTYTYSIANDTANGAVSNNDLEDEIKSSSITIAIENISTSGDDLDIVFKDSLIAAEVTTLNGLVTAHTGVISKVPDHVEVDAQPAFASKYIGSKSLYKRVHGENNDVAANSTENIEHTVTYDEVKFTGAEILGVSLKDIVSFKIIDDSLGTYSGTANAVLNQFGYSVEMPDGGFYNNTSNYDASLYKDMIIRCEYTNNTGSSAYIGVNFEMHEVK